MYRDSNLVGTTTALNLEDTEVTVSGSYVYTVVAVNGFGVASAPSEP